MIGNHSACGYVIDLGPGAGRHGGKLVLKYSAQIEQSDESLTGAYISGRKQIAMLAKRRQGTVAVSPSGST